MNIGKITRELKKFPPLFDLVKKISRGCGYSDPVYEILVDFFNHVNHGLFIQIGANDGMSHDPIREFIISNQAWKGIFIEPIPDQISKCQFSYKFYNQNERFEFNSIAISEKSGVLELWKIKDSEISKFPLFSSGLVSTNRSHFMKHLPNIKAEQLEPVTIEALTYDELLAARNISKVDLVCIDVEGYEAVLVPSMIASHIPPKAILFESDHLQEEVFLNLKNVLINSGYTVFDLPKDCFAVHSGVAL
jgi:FkbM family methyltransferase